MGIDKRGTNGSGPNQKGESKNGPRDRGVKHLSYNDLLVKRQKGLCFKCGGIYSPQHRCPEKHLKIMLADEEVVGEEGRNLEEEVEDNVDGECHTLFLQV